MVESYRDLMVWQRAMDLAVDVYAVTSKLPADERFGLSSQLRRAAVSIPSVLAEGHARSSTREFMRYVAMAMGSLAEVETQLTLAHRLHMLGAATVERLLQSCSEEGRMLRSLRRALEERGARNVPHLSP